ncbi:MAG: hypothetical protein Kow0037_11030 [Calditrichia bacterium]
MNGLRVWAMLVTFLFVLLYISCGSEKAETVAAGPAIDMRAQAIADSILLALGGKKNWENTRYLAWNFLDSRHHIWDKKTGRLHFESKDLLVLMNVNTKKGRAWKGNVEINDTIELNETLEKTYAIWINDSYWLTMPFKLKDPGVHLKYLGEKVVDDFPAYVLELTFDRVGLTPQNKYHVYVHKRSKLIRRWDYFSNSTDSLPKMSSPWNNWRQYGNILLSDSRGEGRTLAPVAVFQELPDKIFELPEPISLEDLIAQYSKN